MTSSTIAGITGETSAISQLIAQTTQTAASGSTQGSAADALSEIGSWSGQDQADVSKMGKLMSQLRQMAATDSDAFAATAQTIADNLAQSAAACENPLQKQAFAAISASFAAAAETGDLSGLESVAVAESSQGAGTDTVDISDQARELATQDAADTSGTSGQSATTTQSGETSADSTSTQSTASSGGSSGGSGSVQTGASASSSSGTDKSEEDIDKEIKDLKAKISKVQAKLSEAKQQGKTDALREDDAKRLMYQMTDLNAQLAELENEKLEAERSGSSSS